MTQDKQEDNLRAEITDIFREFASIVQVLSVPGVEASGEVTDPVETTMQLLERYTEQRVIDALIGEWESIDGEGTYYWDYREMGNATEKIYLQPHERIEELQSKRQSLEDKAA